MGWRGSGMLLVSSGQQLCLRTRVSRVHTPCPRSGEVLPQDSRIPRKEAPAPLATPLLTVRESWLSGWPRHCHPPSRLSVMRLIPAVLPLCLCMTLQDSPVMCEFRIRHPQSCFSQEGDIQSRWRAPGPAAVPWPGSLAEEEPRPHSDRETANLHLPGIR